MEAMRSDAVAANMVDRRAPGGRRRHADERLDGRLASHGRRRDALIIVPAYNEQDSVGDVIAELHRWIPDADVLVVDDGSTDGTAQVARDRGALVLSLPYNLGVGGAMRAGYKFAHRNRYGAAVQVDADGQHDPADVAALLRQLEHADVVIGARFAGRGDYRATGPRRWAMRALANSVSRRASTELTDVTSGFRACNADAIGLFANHYPVEYLGDTVEALVMACQAGLRIRQVPVEMRVRQAGAASQTPWRASLYLFRAVLAMLVCGLRSRQDALVLGAARLGPVSA